MAKAIKIGSIIHLQNSLPNGGYLDTRGWVTDKREFWNVAGTERTFVSTHETANRGGGPTGSWRVISADGKQDGEPLNIGDTIHLLNLYPDAGYLDCCGWVEHLLPFAHYQGQVTSGVFTTGVPNRDNGTGLWTIRSAGGKKEGDSLVHDDAIYLENGHPSTGVLVTHGQVTETAIFQEYQGQQKFVFSSTFENSKTAAATWLVTLSSQGNKDSTPLFDFFRPELLKGRTHNMKGVATTTNILLGDVFQSVGGMSLDEVAKLATTPQDQSAKGKVQDSPDRLRTILNTAKSKRETTPAANRGGVVDYDFQIKQLLNVYTLSQKLNAFDRDILQELMLESAKKHQQKKTPAPLYLYRRCFQHLVTDHEILQRAIIQRRWNQLDGQYSQSNQVVELLVMDKLALRSLTPFQHLLHIPAEQLAVITYFSDTTHIHHTPYTNQYILVGVSYDRAALTDTAGDDEQSKTLTERNFSAFELLAIPHEVGHYIYQQGTLEDGRTFSQVSQKFKQNPHYHWCEEIFADVYGCIIAGPLSVFSMQAFLTSGDRELAWRNDEAHPTPMLRSYILAEILRELTKIAQDKEPTSPKYNCLTIANKLDEDWTRTLANWGNARVDSGEKRPVRIYTPDGSAQYIEKIVNVDKVLEALRPIITEFAKLLLDSFDKHVKADAAKKSMLDIPWSQGIHESTEKYAQEMAALTGWKTAGEEIALGYLLESQAAQEVNSDLDADEQLLLYLEKWGDSGPSGFGAH